jgi:putative Mg2+ transporter-C (MgtC) family protein
MTIWSFFIRIFTAFLLGIIIGFERQYHHRMAGIQTNVLVSVGACLFVMFSSLEVTGDKTRIAAQVVTGVGFLGGGVILREGFNVKGLNTAATLWCTASVGVLASAGYITYAVIGSLVILLSNILLRPLTRKIYNAAEHNNMDEECIYEVTIRCLKDKELKLRNLLMNLASEQNLLLRSLENSNTETNGYAVIKGTIICICKNNDAIEQILNKINAEDGVIASKWEVS